MVKYTPENWKVKKTTGIALSWDDGSDEDGEPDGVVLLETGDRDGFLPRLALHKPLTGTHLNPNAGVDLGQHHPQNVVGGVPHGQIVHDSVLGVD